MTKDEIIQKLGIYGFQLVGSRFVLGDSVAEGTDYDFMQVENPANRILLEKLDFMNCFESDHSVQPDEPTVDNYLGIMCTSSSSIWKHEDFDIQVVLKFPETYGLLQNFWKLMRASPEAFKTKFWKSYEILPEPVVEVVGVPTPTPAPVGAIKPNTKEKIAAEIHYFLKHIMPFVQV